MHTFLTRFVYIFRSKRRKKKAAYVEDCHIEEKHSRRLLKACCWWVVGKIHQQKEGKKSKLILSLIF
jgi:hypothetical protein